MRRREFITLVGGAAAWPLTGRAQQASTRVRQIAVLLRVAKDDPDAQRDLQAFRDGLEALGWLPGKTILIQYRYASADPAQMDAYAAELVGLPAEVILAGGSLAVAALRKATQATPIYLMPTVLRLLPSWKGKLRNGRSRAAAIREQNGHVDCIL